MRTLLRIGFIGMCLLFAISSQSQEKDSVITFISKAYRISYKDKEKDTLYQALDFSKHIITIDRKKMAFMIFDKSPKFKFVILAINKLAGDKSDIYILDCLDEKEGEIYKVRIRFLGDKAFLCELDLKTIRVEYFLDDN